MKLTLSRSHVYYILSSELYLSLGDTWINNFQFTRLRTTWSRLFIYLLTLTPVWFASDYVYIFSQKNNKFSFFFFLLPVSFSMALNRIYIWNASRHTTTPPWLRGFTVHFLPSVFTFSSSIQFFRKNKLNTPSLKIVNYKKFLYSSPSPSWSIEHYR